MNQASALKYMIEKQTYKVGNDGTRYYLLSREQMEEIIQELEE